MKKIIIFNLLIGFFFTQLFATNTQGQLIQAFGTAGDPVGLTKLPFIGTNAIASNLYDIALTGNNIVGVGSTKINAVSYFALAQITDKGQANTGFGNNGTGTNLIPYNIANHDIPPNDSLATSVAINSNGSILLAGYTTTSFGPRFAVAQFTSLGLLDPKYGNNGTNYIENGIITNSANETATCCIMQPANKLVLAGYTTDLMGQTHYAVARFKMDGFLDTTFGENNTGYTYIQNFIIPTTGTDDVINAIGLQTQGGNKNKIIVAGYSISGGIKRISIARFTEHGILDTTFGTNGSFYVTPPISADQGDYEGNALAILPDDSIIIAGNNPVGSCIVKIKPNGTLDTTFAANGQCILINGTTYTKSIYIQSDGKLIITSNKDASNFSVARILSNGSGLDNTFANNGIFDITAGDGHFGIFTSKILSSGNYIIIGGTAQNKFVFFELNNVPVTNTNTNPNTPNTPPAPGEMIIPNKFSKQQLETIENRAQLITKNKFPNVYADSTVQFFINTFKTTISQGNNTRVAYEIATATQIVLARQKAEPLGKFFLLMANLLDSFKNTALSADLNNVLKSVQFSFQDEMIDITTENAPIAYCCAYYVANYMQGINTSPSN